jgi:hypothetical protein
LRESTHIKSLLDDANKSLAFDPQIVRDIKVVNAFASQLGISFDPSLGSAFNRQEGLAEIQSEIDLIKLRNQINRLQQGSSEGNGGSGSGGEGGGSGPNGQESDTTKPDLSKLTNEDSALAKLKETINTLLTNASNDLKKKAEKSQLSPSPEEHFEDLNAYRARLRQRQAEINLDDVHDTLGNTLYRLQLNATVLPGEIKNKYGILDFAIKGSEILPRDLYATYFNWLITLNLRNKEMQDSEFNDPSKVAWNDIIEFLIDDNYVESCTLEGGKETIFITPVSPKLDQETSETSETPDDLDPLYEVKQYIQNKISLIRNKSVKRRVSSIKLKPSINRSLKSARPLSGDLNNLDKNNNNALNCENKRPIPPVFVTALTVGDSEKRFWKADHVYTYQAQPTEKVQRLSTLASAANSMQSAFALAATLPQYGLGIDAGAAASRVAVGMADAVERTPLVIGYTDTDRDRSTRKIRKPHFGYIFGPKAILQTEENQLVYKQVPASHSVFADISVPGWWPALILDTRSVWAGNWHDGSQILKTYNKSREVEVRLRPNTQGFDNLTYYLYSNTVPSAATDIATINAVYPSTVSSCARGTVDFIIKGKNLWRNPSVTFLGQKQDKANIEILPDMDGLLVKVDLNRLPLSPSIYSGKNKIIIWTTFGEAVHISNGRNDTFDFIFDDSNGDCKSSNTALSLSRDKNFYVGGRAYDDFLVKVNSKIPDAIQDYQVIARIEPDRRETLPRGFIKGSSTIPFGNAFKGSITIPPTNMDTTNDTALLSVGLTYKTSEVSEFKEDFSNIKVVYYPTADRAKIKISKNKVNSFNTRDVELNLPDRYKQAYPGFIEQAEFKLGVTGHNDISFRVTSGEPTGKVVKLTVESPTGDQTKIDAFNVALCKDKLSAILSLEKINNMEIPGLISNKIIFVKQAVCPST